MTMGYSVSWTGPIKLDKPLSKEHAVLMRAYERNNKWPGNVPDRFGSPWCLANGDDGLEVCADKPGDWKAWLQYTIDVFLKDRGYAVVGSIEWKGEEEGDHGVVTVENGVVKARSKEPSWRDVPDEIRKYIATEIHHTACCDSIRAAEQGWRAALAHLGYAPTSDRTVFDH
jgi:hypothetical protein